jgi:hypothetical protein
MPQAKLILARGRFGVPVGHPSSATSAALADELPDGQRLMHSPPKNSPQPFNALKIAALCFASMFRA